MIASMMNTQVNTRFIFSVTSSAASVMVSHFDNITRVLSTITLKMNSSKYTFTAMS